MPTRRITTVDRGGGRYALVVLDEDGAELAQAVADFGAPLQIGPHFPEELQDPAVAVTDGVSQGPGWVTFDTAVVDAAQLTKLLACIQAHDPLVQRTPNTRRADLALLEQKATDIVNGTGNQTQPAKDFAAAFLAWSANCPER